MSNFLEENTIKENFSNKKNLLFLIGHLRTIEFILKYHKKFLDQTGSDLIISTWKDDESSDELLEKIKSSLKPIYFEIEDFNFNLTTNIFGNLNKFDLVFGKSALSTRSQVYKIEKINDLVKKFENLQNKKYQVIFKSRPDLFFSSKINLNISSSEIIFESTIGDWRKDRSDRFFYAKRDIFLDFINKLEYFGKKSWGEKAMYPIYNSLPLQEQYIKYCCDKGNFISKPIFPILKVWRPKRGPNIKDIIKIFIFKFIKSLIYRKV